MKALVVYGSVYGNTEKIAQAIARALEGSTKVELLEASQVDPQRLDGFDLLVVGSPTQKFRPIPSVTELQDKIPDGGLKGVKIAAFDTRLPESQVKENKILSFFVNIFGYAAKPIADTLVKKGGKQIAPPEGFIVTGTEGPLLEGELERAGRWAEKLGVSVQA